jgi:hypothetical protein
MSWQLSVVSMEYLVNSHELMEVVVWFCSGSGGREAPRSEDDAASFHSSLSLLRNVSMWSIQIGIRATLPTISSPHRQQRFIHRADKSCSSPALRNSSRHQHAPRHSAVRLETRLEAV